MWLALLAACVLGAVLLGRLAWPAVSLATGVAVWLLQAWRIFDDPVARWGEGVATFNGALAISAVQLSPAFVALAAGIALRWRHRRQDTLPAVPHRS